MPLEGLTQGRHARLASTTGGSSASLSSTTITKTTLVSMVCVLMCMKMRRMSTTNYNRNVANTPSRSPLPNMIPIRVTEFEPGRKLPASTSSFGLVDA